MTDAECVAFLQWALPRLRLRWEGFRKVRRQVCRRVGRRIGELGLAGAGDYRAYLEAHDAEWEALDALCRVTISRFWRDRGVFEALCDELLPTLGPSLRAWSAGCASGEEPYSLVLAAGEAGVALDVLATDVDGALLARARDRHYPPSSLRELPDRLRGRHDVRDPPPAARSTSSSAVTSLSPTSTRSCRRRSRATSSTRFARAARSSSARTRRRRPGSSSRGCRNAASGGTVPGDDPAA